MDGCSDARRMVNDFVSIAKKNRSAADFHSRYVYVVTFGYELVPHPWYALGTDQAPSIHSAELNQRFQHVTRRRVRCAFHNGQIATCLPSEKIQLDIP